MTATASIGQDDVFTVVRAFILSLIACEVVQALDNSVPMPVNGFIAMQTLFARRLATNIPSLADPTPTTGRVSAEAHWEHTLQIDCYGPQAGDWAMIISTLWRDEYAATMFAPVCAPLHCDDPKQMPIVDAEANFENRWLITAVLQYNPVVSTPMQFMQAANVNLIDVDVFYK
jgi:hypothetical protein